MVMPFALVLEITLEVLLPVTQSVLLVLIAYRAKPVEIKNVLILVPEHVA